MFLTLLNYQSIKIYLKMYLKMYHSVCPKPRDPVQGAAAKTCTLALHIAAGDVCLRLACMWNQSFG